MQIWCYTEKGGGGEERRGREGRRGEGRVRRGERGRKEGEGRSPRMGKEGGGEGGVRERVKEGREKEEGERGINRLRLCIPPLQRICCHFPDKRRPMAELGRG